MRRVQVAVAAVLVLILWGVGSAAAQVSGTFGPEAVYAIDREQLFACLGRGGSGMECIPEVMRQSGATPQALAFNEYLDGEAYMVEYRDMGLVGLALVEYPLRANTNQVYFLVGGQPPAVSSEIREELPVASQPEYKALAARFPQVEFWPSMAEFVRMEPLEGGGQGFVFSYPLLDGCRACGVVGKAVIRLDFASDGRYQGPRLLRVQPVD